MTNISDGLQSSIFHPYSYCASTYHEVVIAISKEDLPVITLMIGLEPISKRFHIKWCTLVIKPWLHLGINSQAYSQAYYSFCGSGCSRSRLLIFLPGNLFALTLNMSFLMAFPILYILLSAFAWKLSSQFRPLSCAMWSLIVSTISTSPSHNSCFSTPCGLHSLSSCFFLQGLPHNFIYLPHSHL